MNIVKYKFDFNNDNFIFFAPENDSVVPGTIAGLRQNNWHLDKIDFQKNDIFVDIGCSVGILSMFVAKLFPFIRILSFDANPVAIKCLEMGCKENNISNIQFFNFAIGAENKKNVKFVTYNENESCLVQDGLSDKRNVEYFVDMISINEIFDNYIPENMVKLLKVDIETGEFPLFDHLFDNRPDILDRIEFLHLEIHPFVGEERSERLKKMVVDKFKDKVIF